MRLTVRSSAVAASAALAAITLGTFGVLYDYGPGSAIRRFHQALVNDNETELRRLIVPPRNRLLAREFLRDLDSLVQGGEGRITATQRLDREVRTIVTYRGMGGQPVPVVYVVVKNGERWQIDLEKTEKIVRDLVNGRS